MRADVRRRGSCGGCEHSGAQVKDTAEDQPDDSYLLAALLIFIRFGGDERQQVVEWGDLKG